MGNSNLKDYATELNRLYKQEEILKELISKKPKDGVVVVRFGSYGHIIEINGEFNQTGINYELLLIIKKQEAERNALIGQINDLHKRNIELSNSIGKKRSWW